MKECCRRLLDLNLPESQGLNTAIERKHHLSELEKARQQAYVEQEIGSLHAIAKSNTAQRIDRTSIVPEYAEHIRDYLTGRNNSPTATAKLLANEFAELRLSGTELIRIHLAALKHLIKGLGPDQVRWVNGRTRELVIGVVTNLADRYVEGGRQLSQELV